MGLKVYLLYESDENAPRDELLDIYQEEASAAKKCYELNTDTDDSVTHYVVTRVLNSA